MDPDSVVKFLSLNLKIGLMDRKCFIGIRKVDDTFRASYKLQFETESTNPSPPVHSQTHKEMRGNLADKSQWRNHPHHPFPVVLWVVKPSREGETEKGMTRRLDKPIVLPMLVKNANICFSQIAEAIIVTYLQMYFKSFFFYFYFLQQIC